MKRYLALLLIPLILCLTACSKEQSVQTLLPELTEVVNIKYRGYNPETEDKHIEAVFAEPLADKAKAYFAEGLKDKEIVINDIMSQAEDDRYNDVYVTASVQGLGYDPNSGATSPEGEIYDSYRKGELDFLKNNDMDERIVKEGDVYSIPLSKAKTNPLVTIISLSIYGHDYDLDLSPYHWDPVYKNWDLYNFTLKDYIFYSDGTFIVTYSSAKEDQSGYELTLNGTLSEDGITSIDSTIAFAK